MSSRLSKAGLGVALSRLETFKKAKLTSEQYPTDPEIAATVLWQAALQGELEGKVIVDLGCGTGILGLGALLLGAKKTVLVDSDAEALSLARKNHQKLESEGYALGEAVFREQDIQEVREHGDVVIMNPPFGTKVRHHDRKFLLKAFETAPLVYSFHKTATARFVEALAEDAAFEVSARWDFKFPLKASQGFHRRRLHHIEVSCFRLAKGGREGDFQ